MTKKIILALLLVGGGLFYGYKSGLFNKFLGKVPPASVTEAPIEQPLVGNDKDAYGCIPSAGYTWCEVKQKCLRSWEEACEIDQTAIVKEAMITELTKANGDLGESTVTVAKIEGDFARGGVGGEGGGGMWFAAKVNDNWKLVWAGNGIIYCADLAPYPDLPTSFIPECYDKATESLVTR